MTDTVDEETRSHIMRQVGSTDTEPEMKLRRALWHRGNRYRVHDSVAEVKPDLVFRGPEVAVFVDGCFWHGCPEHYTRPESNTDYWDKKLERNQKRDKRDTRTLEKHGWKVLRFWSCEVDEELERVVREVEAALTENG